MVQAVTLMAAAMLLNGCDPVNNRDELKDIICSAVKKSTRNRVEMYDPIDSGTCFPESAFIPDEYEVEVTPPVDYEIETTVADSVELALDHSMGYNMLTVTMCDGRKFTKVALPHWLSTGHEWPTILDIDKRGCTKLVLQVNFGKQWEISCPLTIRSIDLYYNPAKNIVGVVLSGRTYARSLID